MQYSNNALVALIQQGQTQYKEQLCQQNEKFIRARAQRWLSTDGSNHRRDIEDLAQDGFIGLLRAADSFDASQGFSFLTYAAYWVDQSIRRGLTNGRARADILLSAGSLDEPLKDDEDGGSRIDILQDAEALDPAAYDDTGEVLRRAVSRLPEEQREAVSLFYFDGLTLKQAGAVCGVDLSTISQRKTYGIRRLRHDKEVHRLRHKYVYFRHKSLSAFKSDWTSATEEAVLYQESGSHPKNA